MLMIDVPFSRARLRVVTLVGRRDDEETLRHENPRALVQERAEIAQMLDHLERNHQVKARRCERCRSAGSDDKAEVGNRIVRARKFDGFRRHIDPRHECSRLRQLRRAVAGPTACIQHQPSFRVAPRECIARYMLAPQIVVHLARNDALAGELNQRFAPRGTCGPPASPWSGSTRPGRAGAYVRRSRHRWESSPERSRCRSNRRSCIRVAWRRRWPVRTKMTKGIASEAANENPLSRCRPPPSSEVHNVPAP